MSFPGSAHSKPRVSSYRPIAELLDRYRSIHPQKPALVEVNSDLTMNFRQLTGLVDRTVRDFLKIGLEPSSRVALVTDNNISTAVIWLALWRMRIVICPIDASSMQFQAAEILGLIKPEHILLDASEDGSFDLGEYSHRAIKFMRWSPACESLIVDAPPSPQSAKLFSLQGLPSTLPTDLASISCTSGTTGHPKAVVYDHAALWTNGMDTIELLGLSADDRMLEYRSLGWFSSQILSLMPFLQTGMTLHLAGKFSFGHLPGWINNHNITVSVGLPAIINLLLQYPFPDAKELFSSLRLMTSSTAPLATESWRLFEQAYGVRLLNLYGSSETGWVSGNRLDAHRVGTAGQPVSSVRLEVISEAGKPCPNGDAGFIQICAGKLALGYLQKDGSLTPIRGRPFLMSDVAMQDQDGYLYLLGRRDDMINRGGVKVYPIEIENVLLSHVEVNEAVAIGVPDMVYGEKAVCFVVPHRDTEPHPDDLLAYCRSRLPHNKSPAEIIAVESLPRNHRGKILRDRIKNMYASIKKKQES